MVATDGERYASRRCLLWWRAERSKILIEVHPSPVGRVSVSIVQSDETVCDPDPAKVIV